MFKSLFVLGLMFAAAAAQIPPPTQTKNPSERSDTCTIQGVVVKAGTGEPLHKAWVDATPKTLGHGRTLRLAVRPKPTPWAGLK